MAYYQESKKFSLARMAWAYPLSLLIIFGIADLYAYVNLENPASFFNFLIAGLYMLIIAVVGTLAIEGAKIRHYNLRVFSMILFAVIGLVCAWIFFLALIFEVPFFTVLTDFSFYFESLTGGFTRNGGIPYFSWLSEAALIVGFPIYFVASARKGDKPYCEVCDKWMENSESKLLKLPQVFTLSELEDKIEMDGIRSFLNYDRAHKKDPNHYEFIFLWCSSCRGNVYLSVKRHYTDNSKTIDKNESEDIMNFYQLEPDFTWEELFEGSNDSEDRFNFSESTNTESNDLESYDPNEFDELEEI